MRDLFVLSAVLFVFFAVALDARAESEGDLLYGVIPQQEPNVGVSEPDLADDKEKHILSAGSVEVELRNEVKEQNEAKKRLLMAKYVGEYRLVSSARAEGCFCPQKVEFHHDGENFSLLDEKRDNLACTSALRGSESQLNAGAISVATGIVSSSEDYRFDHGAFVHELTVKAGPTHPVHPKGTELKYVNFGVVFDGNIFALNFFAKSYDSDWRQSHVLIRASCQYRRSGQ